MHLFVTGREGQVAKALAALDGSDLRVTTIGRPELDLTDPASISRALDRLQPDVVVNAAAYTAVDRAESETEAAFAVNRDGAGHAAAAAAAAGLPIIHISTDYVFSGDKASAYVETDPPGPTGAYGASKLAGEHAVAAANPRHVILRTAWVYSVFGNNFLKTMLNLAASRETIRVVSDQRGTPTYAPDIAEGILAVAEKLESAEGGVEPAGVYHMVASGETTWAGFAEEILSCSRSAGGPHATVVPITTADYPTPARRPANSRLDTEKFRRTFGHRLPDWREATAACVGRLLARG